MLDPSWPELVEAAEGIYEVKNAMTMVVSSSSSPSCFWRAASMSAFGAACGVPMCLEAISTASSLVRASQRPSEAMIRNLSSDRILWTVITGSEMMPTLRAQPSPIDRPMASPGFVRLQSSQTRCGPVGSPSICAGETTPPLISILSFSFGSSGLMSVVRLIVSHLFVSLLWRPRTARESPTLAQCSTLSLRSSMTITQVLPLYSTSLASCL
mmetsp:Transcript_87033/g.194588  ORF Transcript_87033/g.194588 Transcript_87033/m.194588 type:complete len:212 (-) Transcript_87033:319-954(-)